MKIIPTDDLSALTDEQIAERSKAARARSAELAEVARTLDAAALQAASAFTTEPNNESLAAREVSAQLARNAHTATEAFDASALPLLAEDRRRAERLELAVLRDDVAIVAKVDASAARIEAIYADMVSRLSAELDVLTRAVATSVASQPRFDDLSRRHGDGRTADKMSMDSAIARVGDRLRSRFGSALVGGTHDIGGARLIRTRAHDSSTLILSEIRFRTDAAPGAR